MSASERAAWRDGVKTGLPTLFGIAAWGMVVGVAMVKGGLTVAQACGMTLVAFAGSAQLASLPLIAAHAPVWVVFATALVVNLRFVIFSALVAPHFRISPPRVACSTAISAEMFPLACICSAIRRPTPSPANWLS
jgi:predicted branched-subunit amino acid permease